MQYVGFWMRALAMVIDIILMNLLAMLLSALMMPVAGIRLSDEQMQAHLDRLQAGATHIDPFTMQQLLIYAGVLSLVSLVAVIVIDVVFPATKMMASPGKFLLGMAITDLNGQRMSVGRAIGRHAAKFVSLLPLGAGFVMAGFTHKKQALHDMMVQTVVVARQSLKGEQL